MTPAGRIALTATALAIAGAVAAMYALAIGDGASTSYKQATRTHAEARKVRIVAWTLLSTSTFLFIVSAWVAEG